jgi:hypothetical protein
MSQDAQMMLARFSRLDINNKQPEQKTRPPKVLVDVTGWARGYMTRLLA